MGPKEYRERRQPGGVPHDQIDAPRSLRAKRHPRGSLNYSPRESLLLEQMPGRPRRASTAKATKKSKAKAKSPRGSGGAKNKTAKRPKRSSASDVDYTKVRLPA